MRWVRTNRRCGGWLALAAMALQLVLSFGHLHLDKLVTGSAVTVAAVTAPHPSSQQHPASDTGDYCAICATIHLAATSFLPDLPQLPELFVSRTIEHFHHVAFIAVARQRTPFQSRAPPPA